MSTDIVGMLIAAGVIILMMAYAFITVNKKD